MSNDKNHREQVRKYNYDMLPAHVRRSFDAIHEKHHDFATLPIDEADRHDPNDLKMAQLLDAHDFDMAEMIARYVRWIEGSKEPITQAEIVRIKSEYDQSDAMLRDAGERTRQENRPGDN